MSNHFTHLHLHTEYSLLDGAIRIPQLIEFAQEQKWTSIGISDHGNIFGAVKFVQACQKAGIKPVIGCEMYLTQDINIKDIQDKYYHLLVIVKNETGYKNLCRLMKFSYQEGFYFKPRIDYEHLKRYADGLMVTTTCLGGHIPSLLRSGNAPEAYERADWFINTFGRDNFFVELQPPVYEKQARTNELLTTLAHDKKLDLITTSDSHFLCEDDHEAHEVLLSVQTRNKLSDPNRYTFGEFRGHLRTTQQMLEHFPEQHDAVWNTGNVADRCNFTFEFGKLFFPRFDVPQEHSQDSYFKHLCTQGLNTLREKKLISPDEYDTYIERLEIEINLIIKMGFVGYFLVVSDFIKWAKEQHISVGPGRGSAAGSLVAWALGITNVDPIKYNLLFERFLNPERVSMPDIDIDFCIERREEVINYVRDKYGHECVCQIITFGTMMAKGVLKDVARVLGFPFKDANFITDLIPNQLKITIDEAIEQEPRLQEMITNDPQVKRLFDISRKLEGITRHASKHAAGVVISPKPLEEVLPLYIPSKSTELVSQYAMTELESLGFLKMDFLGLTNLTLIQKTLDSIRYNYGRTIDLDALPFNDEKTFALLCRGDTDGVFQFESEGIKEVLRKLQPNKFEDLIAVNALYRPGPLGSGMVDDFIERRHGRKKTTYMFPELEPILSETYGVIVYQEQVMKIASTIAGYSLGAADILRRAMGKKKVEVMAEQKQMFTAGATQRGFDAKKAEELFDLMAYFAGYGFNKSHSTAYALIAYHTAYLKANFPRDFMASLISYVTNNPDKLSHYLQDLQEMDITIIPPDINRSYIDFTATKDDILFGLHGIKNVGQSALENIIEERRTNGPFADLLDFCTRIDLRAVNKRVIESLIATGAFDKLPGNRAQQTNELEKIIARATDLKNAAETGQMMLFGGNTSDLDGAPETYSFEPCSEWPDKEKLEKERELAGFYLSSHPLKTYQPLLKFFKLATAADLTRQVQTASSLQEPTVKSSGFLQSFRTITTKKGDPMAFAQLEDFTGTTEIVIFPRLYKKVESLLGGDYEVFLVKGQLDLGTTSKAKIKAESFIPIDHAFTTKSSPIEHINLYLPDPVSKDLCDTIKKTLKPGKIPFHLFFKENGNTLRIKSTSKVSCDLQQLKELSTHGIHVQCIV